MMDHSLGISKGWKWGKSKLKAKATASKEAKDCAEMPFVDTKISFQCLDKETIEILVEDKIATAG